MSTLLAKYATYEEELMGKNPAAITAHAGGGQGSATALTFKWNIISTCASDFDSVKLIVSKQGYQQVVLNDTANILSIYPTAGEKINGIVNARIDIQPHQSGAFECTKDGNWISYANSSAGLQVAHLTLTSSQILALYNTPIIIVPAPGVGYALEAVSGSQRYNKVSVNYAAGGPMYVQTDTAPANQAQLQAGTNLSNPTSFFERLLQGAGPNNLIENKALVVTNGNALYINGDGTADIYICYRIIVL